MRAAEVILRRRAREDIDAAVSFDLAEGAPAAAHGLLVGGRVHVWRVLHSPRDIPESLAPES